MVESWDVWRATFNTVKSWGSNLVAAGSNLVVLPSTTLCVDAPSPFDQAAPSTPPRYPAKATQRAPRFVKFCAFLKLQWNQKKNSHKTRISFDGFDGFLCFLGASQEQYHFQAIQKAAEEARGSRGLLESAQVPSCERPKVYRCLPLQGPAGIPQVY